MDDCCRAEIGGGINKDWDHVKIIFSRKGL